MRLIFATTALLTLAACASRNAHPGQAGFDARRPDGPDRTSSLRGQLFVSPMGEPFRADGPPPQTPPVARWFAQADGDGDGKLDRKEMRADAARFFATLDQNADGRLLSTEIVRYETEILPEIRDQNQFAAPGPPNGNGPRPGGANTNPSGRPPPRGKPEVGGRPPGNGPHSHQAMGAAQFSFLPVPEPVTAADTDLNGVTLDEFLTAASQRFDRLDANGDGTLFFAELPASGPDAPPLGPGGRETPPR